MKLIQTNKELTGYQVWPEVISRLWEAQEKYSNIYMLDLIQSSQASLQAILHNKLVSMYCANKITAEEVGGPIGYMGMQGPKSRPCIDLKDPSQYYKYMGSELAAALESQRRLNKKVEDLIKFMEKDNDN